MIYTPIGPRFNSWSRFLSGRPDLSWLMPWLTTGCRTFSCQSFFFNIATALLSPFFLDLFTRLFVNLTVCMRALFSKPTTTLGRVKQAFWRVPLFTEWIGASSFDVIFAWPSRHSTTGTLSSWTSGSRISLILLHEELGDGFSCVIFARWMTSWRKLQLSPLEHCPLAYHCQQWPRILRPRCFVPWFLTTGFLS